MLNNYQHDCKQCRYLGLTLGNGHLFDLYIHGTTLIARYGEEGSQYYSTDISIARPDGHAELFVAKFLVEEIK